MKTAALYKAFGLTICLMGWAACETVVEVDIDEHEPQLVLNALVDADSLWRVQVSHSVPVLAQENVRDAAQTDATVELVENGQVIERLPHAGGGVYRSPDRRPEPGRTYTVRVSAPGFETVEATQTVPVPIDVTLLSEAVLAEGGVGGNEEFQPAELEWTIRFTDPPNGRNFYYLTVLAVDPINTFPVAMRINDPITQETSEFLETVEDGLEVYQGLLFSDATLAGQTHDLAVRFDVYEGFSTRLVLYTVTEAYYRYRRSRDLQRDTEDNPFAEPAPIFSNVSEGLGIFGVYANAGPVEGAAGRLRGNGD